MTTRSKAVIIGKAALSILFMLALFFVPAGTLEWPEAWLFIVFYLGAVSGLFLWMKKNSPGLLKERMAKKKASKGWDRKITTAYLFSLAGLVVVPGLDAVRFGWSGVPRIIRVLGFIGLIPGLVFAFWSMKENAFASNVVRIQEERGHTVCTSGPYRYVRHPMYLGIILFLLFFPLSLGSLYAYIPAFIIIVLFTIRTSLEDKTLRKELPGYHEYSLKVRHRLFPGVW